MRGASPLLPQAAVIVFPGSNGDRDLYEALILAGFDSRYLPAYESIPTALSVVALPGGFSYGDYWRAGMLAARARAVRSLGAHLATGGLVIGVCNGFQILVEAGYLSGALTYNAPPRFVHRWVDVRVTAAARRSPWFSLYPTHSLLHLPVANGEGNYQPSEDDATLAARVPLVYERNPNGSAANTAAVLDDTGKVLGIMPHPERACDLVLGSSDGLRLFRSAFQWASRLGSNSP